MDHELEINGQVIKDIVRGSNPPIPHDNPLVKRYLGAVPTESGVYVNQQSALGIAAFWRCVSFISGYMGGLPIHLHKHSDSERASNHALSSLLSGQANEWTAFSRLIYCLTAQAIIHGNGYAAIKRDRYGDVEGLYLLDSQKTKPVIERGNLWYETYIDGQAKPARARHWEVIHLTGFGLDPLCGLSLIDYLKDTLGWGITLRKYNQGLFKRGASPRVVVEHPKQLNADQVLEILDTFEDSYSGLDNVGATALLHNGAKANVLPLSNEAAEFLATYQDIATQIAVATGVPPHKVGQNINTSYSSLTEENRAFYVDTLNPQWITPLEAELNSKLLLKPNDKARYYIEINRDAILEADPVAKRDNVAALYHAGLYSHGKAAKILNLPIAEGREDEYLLPSNVRLYEPLPEPGEAPATEELTEAVDEAGSASEEATEGQEPQEETQDVARSALLHLTREAIERIKGRLSKSDKPLSHHREFIIRSLPFDKVNDWYDTLAQELDNVLPEQRAKVIDRINVEETIDALVNNT